MSAPWVLQSRRVVMPAGERPAAIVVCGGRIESIVPHGHAPRSARVEDVGDRVVLPGLVDPHVHINEPGRTTWEGFASATQSAAAGGVTTLVDMPLNSSPVTTTAAALATKRRAAAGQLWVDVGFHAGLVHGNAWELPALLDAGVLGVKAFLCHSGLDEFPAATAADLSAAMPLLARRGVPLLAHAELTDAPAPPPKGRSYAAYLASRPAAWEEAAIALLLDQARATGCRTHIVHLADAGAVATLRAARAAGVPVTVETCPHYLYFAAEDIAAGDTASKCAPPIREAAHRDGLWQALREGVIDLIATDHSPCPPALKHLDDGDFGKAWGGIASLQLGLGAVWTAGQPRGATAADLARWMSEQPAKLVGLHPRKGAIAAGADADLVVWNPDVSALVQAERLYHRHKVTPYLGRRLRGVVERTYLGGALVAENGVVFAPPRGTMLARG